MSAGVRPLWKAHAEPQAIGRLRRRRAKNPRPSRPSAPRARPATDDGSGTPGGVPRGSALNVMASVATKLLIWKLEATIGALVLNSMLNWPLFGENFVESNSEPPVNVTNWPVAMFTVPPGEPLVTFIVRFP